VVHWTTWALTVAVSAAITQSLHAQGGPPLETDDPGTPGRGRFELNIEVEAERALDGTAYDAPNLDINYGAGEYVQLKIEVPWRVATATSRSAHTGLGNAILGLKWRFLESDSGRVALSIYPQLTLAAPRRAAADLVADSAGALLLPVEVAWHMGALNLDAELGYRRSRETSEVGFGAVVAHQTSPRLELLGECNGTAEIQLTAVGVLCGLGVRWALGEPISLLGALEEGVVGAVETRPDHRIDVGVQFRW
jgi:hypothetical protein